MVCLYLRESEMLSINSLFLSVAAAGLAIAPLFVSPAIASAEPIQLAQATTSIEDLLTTLEREEPPLGSRGVLCPISPGMLGETGMVWSDRPLFIWQGQVSQIALRPMARREVIWQASIPEGAQSTAYTGEPLQPGQLYVWQLTDAAGSSNYVFQMLDASERNRVSEELQTLETQLKNSGASEEAIAIERARYFARQGLWSDVLQTLETVDTPSAELTQAIGEMTRYLCGTNQTP
jgi:hypothetical protein